ncbi:MAG TPA: adenylate/guanylate cyclase domain-containing protein [Actinomycetota bacterium]
MSDPASDPASRLQATEKENRLLTRKLSRLEQNVRQMEEIQDANSKLLSKLMLELEQERAKSHRLLLNILPQQIIDRLETGESVIADRYESVTVLFSDFVGFTSISARMAASVLVEELNRLFLEFDALCQETSVEKIKTIGDAYMAVGGLPDTRPDHTVAVAEMALEMLAVIERVNATAEAAWKIRIGVHTGPAVAGVIGSRKFVYDVWGDTVNMASRLESSSLPGRIHVSKDVADRLGSGFLLEPRGTVELKGKGATETFFLSVRNG